MAGAHEQAMSELLKTKEKEQARYIGQFQVYLLSLLLFFYFILLFDFILYIFVIIFLCFK